MFCHPIEVCIEDYETISIHQDEDAIMSIYIHKYQIELFIKLLREAKRDIEKVS